MDVLAGLPLCVCAGVREYRILFLSCADGMLWLVAVADGPGGVGSISMHMQVILAFVILDSRVSSLCKQEIGPCSMCVCVCVCVCVSIN